MKYRIFVSLLILQTMALLGLYALGSASDEQQQRELAAKREIVRELMLADLAIWTETRYTRHPSQADLFTPFQDYPGSLDHFPAGSIVVPPAGMKADSKIFTRP